MLRATQSTSTKQKITSQVGGTILIVLAAILLTTSSTENIGGVVNDYSSVSYVEGKKVVVADPGLFGADDKILIMQMKGATISSTDDETYGDILTFGESGNFEIATVRNVSGDTLNLTLSLCRTYAVEHLVQVVRVPVYGEADISSTLTADAWDGSSGGVVVIEATEKIILSANIDVSEKGFRGGDRNGSARTGGLTYICDFNSGQGGIKGEGIVELAWAACRGKLANGGGGANDHNGGGGGGSNYGAGGNGGHGWKGYNISDTDKGGRGGLSLSPYYDAGLPKLFLGGGGGGGHQNNGASYPAGIGGGIVILISPVLEVPSKKRIKANGEDALDHNINDGAGGGGGGGSILLQIDDIVSPSNLRLVARGGDGASLTTGQQHGPGGGGGGGLINTVEPLEAGVVTNVSGGDPGIFNSTESSNPYDGTSHGAEAGADGAIVNNFFLPTCSAPPTLDLNGAEAGVDFTGSFTPRGPAISIVDSNLLDIQDMDDIEMVQMVVYLEVTPDGEDETLGLPVDPAILSQLGLSSFLSAEGDRLTINGDADIVDYLWILGRVTYHNTAEEPDQAQRSIEINVDDGGAMSNTANAYVTFESGYFPVEWLGFEVEQQGSDAQLIWLTAQEMNNNYFEIERAEEGGAFEVLGQVQGNGNTTEVSSYDFLDTSLGQQQGTSFIYRLRQVDYNGNFEYSNRVQLYREASVGNFSVSAYPNPAQSFVNLDISGASQEKVAIQIMNMSGQVLHSQSSEVMGGAGSLRIELPNWSSGTYLIQVRAGSLQKSLKLVVQ